MSRLRMSFAYDGVEGEPFDLPAGAQVLEPPVPEAPDAGGAIRDALEDPLGAPPLHVRARGASSVVLLVEDAAWSTPTRLMLRHVGAELARAAVPDAAVSVLVARDTHRAMTRAEIDTHIGPEHASRWRVLQHDWLDGERLARLGTTRQGLPVVVNRLIQDADLVVALGQARVDPALGFAGGASLVVPGASGPESSYWAWWASAREPQERLLGTLENPVRTAIEDASVAADLDAALNVALDARGRVQHACYGAPAEAQRASARAAAALGGVALEAPADIVVAEAAPADRDGWQALHALLCASIAVKEGGILILVAPAREGIAPTHPEIEEYAGLSRAEIAARVERNDARDMTAAAAAYSAARVKERCEVTLVTSGIPPDAVARMGMRHAPNVQKALDDALREYAVPSPRVVVMRRAGSSLPVVGGRNAPFLPESTVEAVL